MIDLSLKMKQSNMFFYLVLALFSHMYLYTRLIRVLVVMIDLSLEMKLCTQDCHITHRVIRLSFTPTLEDYHC